MLAALSIWLALMGLAGVTNINAYLAVATLIGIASAFEMPMRQTLFKDIVEDRALVTSASASAPWCSMSAAWSGRRMAGVLLVYLSEAWCFVLNA